MLSYFKYTILTLLALSIYSCTNDGAQTAKAEQLLQLQGKTMGTTYSILYRDSLNRNVQASIDSLLQAINNEVSTYIPTSTISRFNQSATGIFIHADDAHFTRNFNTAYKIYQQTDGWFNPCVMPLVNYWGFGYTEKKPVEQVDSAKVDSLLQLVNFEGIKITAIQDSFHVSKAMPHIQLDFSAIAKGDAVDELGRFLESKGIQNYMVEIGGEVRCRGKALQEQPWRIGINTPQEDAALTAVQQVAKLQNLSLATSGNYRNFYEMGDQKYAHTINPKTGYPEKNTLLSASIFTEDCAYADAYATAFMAMGMERARALAPTLPIETYFIYTNKNTMMEEKSAGVEVIFE